MATATFSAAAPVVIPAFVGVVPGDLLVVQVGYDSGTGATTITAPPGWTLVRRDDHATDFGQALYIKVVGAAEPADYTWVLTGNPSTTALGLVYRGVDTAVPLDVHAGAVGDGTALTAPALVTTVPGDIVVVFFGHDSPAATLTPAAPLVTRATANAAESALAADLQLVGAGAAGPWTATSSLTNQWTAQAITLRRR
ncbi:MAG: hypothetical protein HY904_05725 [Deltaproteobacteria bacterium]|nr:hypothetical protein [Deltaproteobacteria bacterium]